MATGAFHGGTAQSGAFQPRMPLAQGDGSTKCRKPAPVGSNRFTAPHRPFKLITAGYVTITTCPCHEMARGGATDTDEMKKPSSPLREGLVDSACRRECKSVRGGHNTISLRRPVRAKWANFQASLFCV